MTITEKQDWPRNERLNWKIPILHANSFQIPHADDQIAENNSFFQIFKWSCALVVINVNVGF